MRFQGRICRNGRWWLAEVPVFDAMTQGRSRKDAFEMISDWFATMVDRRGFSVEIHPTGTDDFEVGSEDSRAMISLLLRRQRQRSGLTLAQVAQRLGARSRNAYARYEQGVPCRRWRSSTSCFVRSRRGETSWCARAMLRKHREASPNGRMEPVRLPMSLGKGEIVCGDAVRATLDLLDER